MNRSGTTTSKTKSASDSGDDRDLFVINDHQAIPAGELRWIVGGTGAWIKAVVNQKLGRSKSQPAYAIELRRMKRAKHVPKRMEKYMDGLRSKLEALNFSANFDATIAAVGPYVSAIMAMSRRDGDIHFLAHRVTRQDDRQLIDEGEYRFVSWLTDGGLLVTSSNVHSPRPRSGVDWLAIASEDPATLLKKHRERMRQLSIENVSPTDFFDRFEAENRNQTDDWLRRGVVRLATPAEVTRIRTELRV